MTTIAQGENEFPSAVSFMYNKTVETVLNTAINNATINNNVATTFLVWS